MQPDTSVSGTMSRSSISTGKLDRKVSYIIGYVLLV